MQGGYGYSGWWGGGWWWIWWVVWIVIIVWALAWWLPGTRSAGRSTTPLEVLQHRLARGEITPEEYERRKALLERDRKLPPAA